MYMNLSPAALTESQLIAAKALFTEFIANKQPVMDSEDILSKYGFADGDVFAELTETLTELPEMATLSPEFSSHDLLFAVARTVLVPELEKNNPKIELAFVGTAHNPARISRVGGLSGNDRQLRHCIVPLTAEHLLEAFEATLSGRAPAEPGTRASVLTDGLLGLVGRHVDIQVGSSDDDVVSGQLLRVTPDALILGGGDNWGGDFVKAVPLSSVRSVTSYQLTRDEEEALGLA